jgi:hypothetical protein
VVSETIGAPAVNHVVIFCCYFCSAAIRAVKASGIPFLVASVIPVILEESFG